MSDVDYQKLCIERLQAVGAAQTADIKELEAKIEELNKQVAMDTQRFKEMEQHGLELEEENIALRQRGDKWKEKNMAAVGLLNKLAERTKRKEAELAVHVDVSEYRHRQWFEFHNPGKTLTNRRRK